MAVTDHIEELETILDFAVNKLETYGNWSVEKYPGTDHRELFDYLPGLSVPAAVVSFDSESYQNNPRASIIINVLIVHQSFNSESGVTAREHLRRAVSLLDKQVLNHAVFEAKGAKATSLGSGVAAYIVEFEVSDH